MNMSLLSGDEDEDTLYGAMPMIQRDQNVTSFNLESDQPRRWSSNKNQHLAAVTAALAAMCAGAVQGWTAPALPFLLHEGACDCAFSAGAISANQASWIGAIAALGGLLGALPAGHLADTLGRRGVLLLLSVPFALSWLLIVAFPTTVPVLYTSRLIAGVAMGAVTVVVPIYNEEVAEDHLRGPLGVYLDLMVTLGILWSYSVGALVTYHWLAVLCTLLPLFFAVTFWWVPESPVFLASKDRWEEVEKTLRWLRGSHKLDDQGIKQELVRLHVSVAGVRRHAGSSMLTILSDTATSFYLGSPTGKASFIITGLMVVQQLTFINAFLFYIVDIFRNIAGSSVSPLASTIVVGVVQCLATIVSFFLVEVSGRRVLLIASELLISVSLGTLAVDILLTDDGTGAVTATGWVPLVCFSICMIAYSFGLGPLPWLIMAEISPVEHKGFISSLAVFINWVLVFAVTYMFNDLIAVMGPALTYGGVSVICFLGTLFIFFFVPETKGKSREQIQDELKGRCLFIFSRP